MFYVETKAVIDGLVEHLVTHRQGVITSKAPELSKYTSMISQLEKSAQVTLEGNQFRHKNFTKTTESWRLLDDI